MQVLRGTPSGSTANTTKLLSDQVARRRGALTTKLLSHWHRAIQVTDTSLSISQRVGHGVRLHEFAAAMQTVGILATATGQLAERVLHGVLAVVLGRDWEVQLSVVAAEHLRKWEVKKQAGTPGPVDVFPRLLSLVRRAPHVSGFGGR